MTVTILDGRHITVIGILDQLRHVLGAANDDGTVEIVVGDNGHGMSEELQSQIFQPFYTTKGDLENGLGLYITQEIVQRHGGRLIVDSTVGTGTHGHVLLPPMSA